MKIEKKTEESKSPAKEEQPSQKENVADNNKPEEKKTEEGKDTAKEVQDADKDALIKEFTAFKQDNPNGSLQEFYAYLAKRINQEESND